MSKPQAKRKQDPPLSPSPSRTRTQAPVGGSVGGGTPGSSEEGERPPSPVPALAEVLADYGVWLLDAGRREGLAAELAGDGASLDELGAVCAYVEAQAGHDPEMTGKRLAKILRPGVWQRTRDTAARHAQRRSLEGRDKRGHDHGETLRDECDRQARASRDDGYRAMQVYALLRYDLKTPRDVAAELEISVGKLPALVRAGAQAYGADADKAVDELLMRPAR